jgi:hypothetical protein
MQCVVHRDEVAAAVAVVVVVGKAAPCPRLRRSHAKTIPFHQMFQ